MAVQLEQISLDPGRSFRLLVTPHLNDFFLWHFHPEYELVFIENADGPRHVGEHSSRYVGSDLVLIGPYIPHLNFDYGVRTDYHKIVVQLREDFLGGSLHQTPELTDVARLLTLAQQGVAFGEATKQNVGPRLRALPNLSHFRQLMELLEIFQELALAADATLLHPQPVGRQHSDREQERLKRIYRYLDAHYAEPLALSSVAEEVSLTPAAFCRYFKKMTRMTFTEFVNQYRVRQAKNLLLQDKTVTEAAFASGFDSLSYFNRQFNRITGEGPLQFKKRTVSAFKV